MIKTLKHNMGYGFIPESILSTETVKLSMNHALSKKENDSVNYLLPDSVQGDENLRNNISKFFLKENGCYMNPKNISINFGCTQGLHYSILATLKKGDKILAEVPTFFNAVESISNCFFEIIPVKRNDDGQYCIEEIEKLVIEHNIKGFYTVATFSNPIGINLSHENRCKLYQLAKKHKFYVYCDDIYELLYIEDDKRELPTFFCDERSFQGQKDHLATFDNNTNEYVILMNSFNKLVCCQLKIGFVLAHENVINKLNKLSSVKSYSFSFTQHILNSYFELG